MGGLKTSVSACLVAFVLAPTAQADTQNLATLMAGCVGRFSAEVEHAWLLQNHQSDALEQQRENFLAILDAIAPVASSRDLLALRVDAKQAQAALLHLGTFGTKKDRASWARQQARHYRDRCTSLLLDS